MENMETARAMKTILLISPYWKEPHRWMVSTVKLAELWQRLGYRVIVACMGEGTEREDMSPTLTIYRKKDLFLKDPWNYGIAFGFSGMVARIAREEKPDVIVCNKILFWSTFSLIGLRLRGYRPILLTDALVGMTWFPRSSLARVCARLYAWTAGWLLLRLAQSVVFFHPQPERLLRRLGIAKKSRVIPTGIDPSGYGRTEADSDQKPDEAIGNKRLAVSTDGGAASRYPPPANGSSDGIAVTYVGRLESIKGVDDFLAAAAPLAEQYPRLTVQVAGWYKPEHPLVARYDKTVHFLGLRDDVAAVLAKTHIFVLPSHSEGLSNALMEAMASGCACIATDVGGNAFLLQNGISGLLYPPGDVAALRAHLERLIQDPAKRRSLGAAARARIDAEFSWEIVGKRYAELFSGIA
jgi:glycosyltransferase involved in cell wall biosynthesis